MDTKILLVALIALVIGVGGGYALAANKTPDQHMMANGNMMHGSMHSGMQGEMEGMMAGLAGKTGDDFDKAFLAEMIMHHEGAVDMAEAALRDAKHAEIKQMANAIIAAQTTEINQMKQWQEAWYGR
ncbi:MAG: DUF305 domain-containing protein [Patescibacteria group bacterium]